MRVTRMAEGNRGVHNFSRLKGMKLTTLETRRLRADLLEVYKIVNGLQGLSEEYFFERRKIRDGACGTRENSHSFFKKGVVAKFSFANRVLHEWNRLPNSSL